MNKDFFPDILTTPKAALEGAVAIATIVSDIL
jgi:hypothetical protein